jgi:hypothetical protein
MLANSLTFIKVTQIRSEEKCLESDSGETRRKKTLGRPRHGSTTLN